MALNVTYRRTVVVLILCDVSRYIPRKISNSSGQIPRGDNRIFTTWTSRGRWTVTERFKSERALSFHGFLEGVLPAMTHWLSKRILLRIRND